MAENESQKIVVEVPSDRGRYSPAPIPHSPNKLELFRRGWVDTLALPDNLPDLAFDLTTCLAIPALLTSCWVSIPFTEFLRLAALIVLAIAAICLLYLRQAVPEVRDVLLLRVGLVAVGVFLGI